MSHSYIAYIDESGDDGLDKFRERGAEGGASVWLTITACIIRASRELGVVSWRDEIASNLPNKKRRDIHFTKLNHSQRMMAARVLSDKQLRLAHVISNKAMILEGVYREKKQLYFYLTRYLIERLSSPTPLARAFRGRGAARAQMHGKHAFHGVGFAFF